MKELKSEKMGRGVSAGGGQSSLGYLFGSGETTNNSQAAEKQGQKLTNGPSQKPAAASPPLDNNKQIPAGIHGSNANNYLRADGQNCGNFITDRPSTKVHAAPGGGSSLGYLFGGGGN
uniref:Protein SPIRAL1-like 2 n=1 Tax=Davidia involucrata TaxID=16924 RepID=A0A5B6YVL7_DAVIN